MWLRFNKIVHFVEDFVLKIHETVGRILVFFLTELVDKIGWELVAKECWLANLAITTLLIHQMLTFALLGHNLSIPQSPIAAHSRLKYHLIVILWAGWWPYLPSGPHSALAGAFFRALPTHRQIWAILMPISSRFTLDVHFSLSYDFLSFGHLKFFPHLDLSIFSQTATAIAFKNIIGEPTSSLLKIVLVHTLLRALLIY